MNIILYVNCYIPAIGGREIAVHYLARQYKKMGHKVRVVGPSGWLKHRRVKFEYPVHRWPTLKGFFPDQVNYTQLRLDVGLWGADVIHAHTTFPNGYAAAQLKKRFRIPLVITPHGEDIHKIPKIGYGQRMDPVIGQKIDKAIQSAEILTALSESIEDSIISAGCPQGKIRRIANGIDCERFQRKNLPDIYNWLNVPKEAQIILLVGNYRPIKGHEVVLQAMPSILAQQPQAYLVIVGRGSEKLLPLVDRLKIANNVRLTGSIPFPTTAIEKNEDLLAALYCNSDVYISASIDEGAEGLSLALLDAMAARLPVVATKISGNKDIVNEGRTGFLVSPSDVDGLANAAVKILKNSVMKAKMGCEGFNAVKSYNWHNIALRYLDIYNEAIDSCHSCK